MVDRVARQLGKLLEKEHAALLAGDFESLFAMTDEKEAALEAIEGRDLSHQDGVHIASQIARNQALLEASARGVRSADKILGQLRQATTGSIVYGPKGQVSRMETGSRGLSQKL